MTWSKAKWLVIGGLIVGVAAAAMAADWYWGLPDGLKANYVGTQTCAKCHQPQEKLWQGSHHDRAMDHATESTVLGDFQNAKLEHKSWRTGESYGITSTMFKRDGKFFINTEGPDGKLHDYEIKFTFGLTPLQQYLVEMDGGRLQALSVAWNTEKKEWFLLDMEGDHVRPDDPLLSPLHWTGRGMNWNHMCADCHSTNLEKKYDLATRTFHTSYSEINVACEACHGPGSIHVQLAESKSLFWDRQYGYGLARLKQTDTKPQIETCAKCHSRRHVVDPHQRPGDEYLDHYIPELLDTHVYHADGQIQPTEEAYVYGSFLQSKMFRKGIRCTDCHDPHSTRLKADGNQLCAKCHVPAKYDSPSHHFHKEGSTGAKCVECHMPATTYMLVDPRRDHSIRIPRPDLTVSLKQKYNIDVPNACNRCHTKPTETPEWAAEKVRTWFPPKPKQEPHFGETFAGGRVRDPAVLGQLDRMSRYEQRENFGPIVRATAVVLAGRYGNEESEEIVKRALSDPEPLVRFAATRSLQEMQSPERVSLAVKMLDDPVRAVRIEAGLSLTTLPEEQRPWLGANFHKAIDEFKASCMENADLPGAHFELGTLYSNLGEDDKAEEEYKLTLEFDPVFQQARGSLAALYRDRKDVAAGEKVLREAVELYPNLGAASYALGIYLAEQPDRREEALKWLQKAAQQEPEHPLFLYNYGLMLQQAGRYEEALAPLAKACQVQPEADRHWLALMLMCGETGRWEKGREAAEVLLRRNQGDVYYGLLYGLMLSNVGEQKVAEGYLRLASTELLVQLAGSWLQQGYPMLARSLGRELLRRDPDNPQYRMLSGSLPEKPTGPQPTLPKPELPKPEKP